MLKYIIIGVKGKFEMNIWHDISPEEVTPESFSSVIEISKGSKMKYELDKATGIMRLDRILYTSTRYPANYGFIPRTYGDDNDPLDVLVICSEPINPMTLVRVYPIGVINMVDAGMKDEKIIAIPFSDPTYNLFRSIFDLPKHIFDEMSHFFQVYKQLENKETAVDTLGDSEEAKHIISRAMNRYYEYFKDGVKIK